MTIKTCADVLEAITDIEQATSNSSFIESRYPYTYAYDYLRSHNTHFGIPSDVSSRSEMAKWCHENFPEEEHSQVLESLADAYMREWGIRRPVA